MARYIDNPDLYIKKGKRVRAHIKVNDSYRYAIIVKGTIIDDPMCDGQPAEDYDLVDRPDKVTFNIKKDDSDITYEATADICDPLRPASELLYEEWLGVRDEISLGSIFISDYYNSYGVDEEELCDMCYMYLSEVDDSEISPESFARYMFEYAQR